MKFDTLNKSIPYVHGGKKYFYTETIYPGVEISAPGRHELETSPIGGDAVVMITDEAMEWNRHQFTHSDLFIDAGLKKDDDYWKAYLQVLQGADPAKSAFDLSDTLAGVHPMTLLYASQVLSLIEYRRYAQHEAVWGGRFLAPRFTFGIVEGLWSAAEASSKQRYGRSAVERFEKTKGMPELTRQLMGL